MASDLPLFTSCSTFLRLDQCTDPATSQAQALILGAPFDLATTGRSGARSGPGGIRQASANLAWEQTRWPWDFDAADFLQAADLGDVATHVGDPRGFIASLQAKASSVVDAGKHLLTLGGDHY
ncbi:MAG: arginase family protein, partial [Proteobacteria bacterium]|nr:arginase family protein [Pseudomonadota bacterium]